MNKVILLFKTPKWSRGRFASVLIGGSKERTRERSRGSGAFRDSGRAWIVSRISSAMSWIFGGRTARVQRDERCLWRRFYWGRIAGLKDGGIVRDNGADPRRHRRRRHGLRALASVYEEVLQGAAGHQESAGENPAFFIFHASPLSSLSPPPIFTSKVCLYLFERKKCRKCTWREQASIVRARVSFLSSPRRWIFKSSTS